jgi:Type II secretion system (T2SS), protein J
MMDPLTNVYAQTVFGLYGDQKTLVMNTLCARRPTATPSDPNAAQTGATHGDLKTVAYFMSTGLTSAAPGVPTTGLARVEGDHTAIGYTMMQSSSSLASQARIIAPEVASISFRYFDGTQWQTTWDASYLQLLPTAVEITINVRAADPNNPTAASTDPASTTLRTYRHVVAVSTMAQSMSIAELATIPAGTTP